MASALTFVSFSCACGAEVHLPEYPGDATEIVCVGCGEWIGVYAELMPVPKRRRAIAPPKRVPRARKKKSSASKATRSKRR